MRKVLFIALLAFPVLAFSQSGRYPFYTPMVQDQCTQYEALELHFLNNNTTAEKGNLSLTFTGATYTTTAWEGTHAADCNGSSRYLSYSTYNFGNIFTISVAFRKTTWTGTPQVFTMWTSSNGFFLDINATSSPQFFRFWTGNGTNTQHADSGTMTLSTTGWYYVTAAINKTAGKVTVWLNGNVIIDNADIRTDFNTNGVLMFGGTNYWWYGSFDAPQVAGWLWTEANHDDAYTNSGREQTICQ